jgi:Putative Flp pilus-assembly TadE/G-like
MMMRKLRSFTISMAARHGVKSARLDRFRSEEDGALFVFGLIIFTLMLTIGGMAVDFMYHERMRTDLVQTLDRSVLAAANLKQTLDPVGVVEDFFEKAGMTRYLQDVSAEEGLNYTTVRARAKAETFPNFLHWVGINKLPAFAASAATQEIPDVEIQLVLDVSGSMNEATVGAEGATTKIAALKKAAKRFVQLVLDDGGAERISIGMVPYNAQVNLGPDLRAKYTIADWHGVADINCVELSDATFDPGMSDIGDSVPKVMAFADTMTGTQRNNSVGQSAYLAETTTTESNGAAPLRHYCGPDYVGSANPAVNAVLLPTNDVPTLNNRIDGLYASGWTSIAIGMRWGLALIDPGARSKFAAFAAAGKIPAQFSIRPYDYHPGEEGETKKVIVLMTDGIHTTHERVKDAYKSGLSPIWLSAQDGKYSMRFATAAIPAAVKAAIVPAPSAADVNMWWVPHRVATVSNTAATVASGWQAGAWDGVGVDVTGDGRIVTQLTWNEVWQRQRVSWVAWQFYARALGGVVAADRTSNYNTYKADIQGVWKDELTMDGYLGNACTVAKNNGVVVYTIALEAPTSSKMLLGSCATAASPSSESNYFFDATDAVELDRAFNLIAADIGNLRLTQ